MAEIVRRNARVLRQHDEAQFLGTEIRQIVHLPDFGFAELHQHGRRQPVDLRQRILDAQRPSPFGQFGVAALEEIPGALAQGLGDILVEGLDGHQVFERHEGDFLDRREALRHQQVGDDVVDIQRLDEHGAAGAELFLAALGFGLFGQDVDVPAGKLRGQAHILAAPADGEALLFVGHDDLDGAGVLVQHDLGDLGRRQGVDDEGGVVARPGDDVDLLTLQLLHHGLDPAAAHADAGADRVDRAVVGDDGDLRPRTGVARHGADLDDAVVDFRHFLGE